MAFKMGVNKEELQGLKPVPAGQYDVLFVGFNPKYSAKGDSVNFNAKVKIINRPDLGDNRFVFASLNTGIWSFIQDFVHSFGVPMEDQLGETPTIPGVFDADKSKFKEDDPTTWVYSGPLTGRTAKWELGEREYQGKPQQDIVRYFCGVADCAQQFGEVVRHSTDMRRKS